MYLLFLSRDQYETRAGTTLLGDLVLSQSFTSSYCIRSFFFAYHAPIKDMGGGNITLHIFLSVVGISRVCLILIPTSLRSLHRFVRSVTGYFSLFVLASVCHATVKFSKTSFFIMRPRIFLIPCLSALFVSIFRPW